MSSAHISRSDFGKAAQVRQDFADMLSPLLKALKGLKASDTLKDSKLESSISRLDKEIGKLRDGIFRILIIGQFNAGKTTLLNGLIGEPKFLPTGPTACTYIPTVVKYGESDVVRLYKKNGQVEQITLDELKANYQIDTTRAEELRENRASIEIDRAEIEYPLEILRHGIEIVDSAGLNHSEIEDQKTLGYLSNCHAVLFVVSATQNLVKTDIEYLKNYIRGNVGTVFFLLNQWDTIKNGLTDPDDPEELEKAEKEIRNSFIGSIAKVLDEDKEFIKRLWGTKVFEISAKNEERRVMGKGKPHENSKFSEFSKALDSFLLNERLSKELSAAFNAAQAVYAQACEAIDATLLLAKDELEVLQFKAEKLAPKFREIKKIAWEFQKEVEAKVKTCVTEVSNSFNIHINNWLESFEEDYRQYEPKLEKLSKEAKDKFVKESSTRFETYFQGKYFIWERFREDRVQQAYNELAEVANHYVLNLYFGLRSEIHQILRELPPSPENVVDSTNPIVRSPRFSPSLTAADTNKNSGLESAIVGGVAIGSVGASVFLPIGLIAMSASTTTAATTATTATAITLAQGAGAAELAKLIGALGTTSVAKVTFMAQIAGVLSCPITWGVVAPTALFVWIGAKIGWESEREGFVSNFRSFLKEELKKKGDVIVPELRQLVENEFSNWLESIPRMKDDIQICEAPLNRLIELRNKKEFDYETEAIKLTEIQSSIGYYWEKIQNEYEIYKT